MENIILFLLAAIASLLHIVNSISTSDYIISAWKKGSGAKHPTYNAYYNIKAVHYMNSSVYVKADAMPDYTIGPWQVNPFTPSAQNYVFEFPAYPTVKLGAKYDISMTSGPVGVYINGVPIFNANDAYSYNDLGVWHRNAYYWEGASFDSCYGHPESRGAYHHHANPKCLYNSTNSVAHSPIIGFAFDGYPVYGPFAFTTANNSASAIKRMTSSYGLRTAYTVRQTLVNGTTLTSTFYGPNVGGNYTNGAFIEDYQYNAGSGDLDACNGRWEVTPEYPAGTYAYHATVDSTGIPVYPFGISYCYYGVHKSLPQGMKTVDSSATVYYDVTKSSATSVLAKTFLISLVLIYVSLQH